MNQRQAASAPDYLIIGHLTRDLVGSDYRLGGTAAYASILVQRMGLRAALATSFAADLDPGILDGISISNQAGESTTTFNNLYSSAGRTQIIRERAPALDLDLIPPEMLNARVVHLGPVAGELPILGGSYFPAASLGYSLQGWLRSWDDAGRVYPAELKIPRGGKPAPGTAFLSIEDLGEHRSALPSILTHFPDTVLTTGSWGAELYSNGQVQKVSTKPGDEIDPTGAGDIFAAAYLVARHIDGRSELEAARFANILAGISITREGLDGIPTAEEINEAQRKH